MTPRQLVLRVIQQIGFETTWLISDAAAAACGGLCGRRNGLVGFSDRD